MTSTIQQLDVGRSIVLFTKDYLIHGQLLSELAIYPLLNCKSSIIMIILLMQIADDKTSQTYHYTKQDAAVQFDYLFPSTGKNITKENKPTNNNDYC